jgi:hypothetical protein
MFANQADQFVDYRRQQLLEEADHERLLAQLPHTAGPGVRHGLASACYRMANWLDADWYARPAKSGREDWAQESVVA